MMTALLLYAYGQGIYSSRRIARACRKRMDFAMIVAMDVPDFRTISAFRKRHLKALGEFFVQVLAPCEQANLAELAERGIRGCVALGRAKHPAGGRLKRRGAHPQAMR